MFGNVTWFATRPSLTPSRLEKLAAGGGVRRVGLAIATIGVIAVVGLLWFLRAGPFRPALTCALDDQQVCADTLDWVGGWDPGWALYPELQGRITAVDVRPKPAEWAASQDPGFRDAGWAALLYRDGYAPLLAACGYGSGREVLCDTDEAKPLSNAE